MDVMDIACNSGYGSYMISRTAKYVMACDISKESIDFANKHWKADNIEYAVADLLKMWVGNLYDVVVSLETIEHIFTEYSEIVAKLKQHIKPYGLLILSFPKDEQREPDESHVHTKIKERNIVHALTDNGFFIDNYITQGNREYQSIVYEQVIIVARRQD
jgi:2-polyprenyl-3-methyl-5-hydroxy-6-metoxy-1,4-benzoquinol methylase